MATSFDTVAFPTKEFGWPCSTATKTKIVVVGGGMASHGFCRSLIDLAGNEPFEITVFGDEPHLPYDRVHLSQRFAGKTKRDLQLSDEQWYEDHCICFHTDCPIIGINPGTKTIVDHQGITHRYDKLVLATGSHPFVPPIPGRDHAGVFVYRTLQDLDRIQSHVETKQATKGAVIGGGLLGLEAAKILRDLGLQTAVIEMAPGLMPRQLDPIAAERLKAHVQSIGVDVHLVRRTQRINSTDHNQLSIEFANADPLDVDIVIIAAGVRPNDQLAAQAGLMIGSRGGIAVNEWLETSAEDIYAIGECASFAGHIYGLVAPCYRMAETLAKRFTGHETIFTGADESAELKLMGVEVVTLGRAIGQSASGIVLSHQNDQSYRKLIIEQGKVVGAACVGPWPELPQVRQAIHKQKFLWPIQRIRFRKTGSPWSPGGSLPVAQWPADAVICSCIGVTRAEISAAIGRGCQSLNSIALATKASTACGSCQSLVCELIGDRTTIITATGSRSMLVASACAAILCLAVLVSPAVPMATSVQSSWRSFDVLWRDEIARQVTGFTSLALIAVGLVFSLRKRSSWFQFGSYSFWRSVHGVLGATALVAVAVHTGLRMGQNLNFVLAVTFLAVAAVGSLVGITSGLETKLSGVPAMWVRRMRPRLTILHRWLFWPLPALIVLHIISFYWFSD